MRNNAGYAQSRLRAARVYQPMAVLPNVVRRVALIPSELEPGRRSALPQEAGCYDAYRQIIAADCAAHVRKKSGARQKSSPFGE
jgi:hypothetical protein